MSKIEPNPHVNNARNLPRDSAPTSDRRPLTSGSFAILFLDNLELQQHETRAELSNHMLVAASNGRPFMTLGLGHRRIGHSGSERRVWMHKETNYLDKLFAPPDASRRSQAKADRQPLPHVPTL